MLEAPDGVVARAFAILRAFDETHPELSLSSLARRSGLPINTALRIARSLVAEGALERDETGPFRVGLRLWEIATLAPRGVGLRTTAAPYLADLQELTGHHALLMVREGDEGVLVDRASPRGREPELEYRIGGRVPLASTGGGSALLAFAPEEVRTRAIDHAANAEEATRLRRTIAATWRTDVAIIRRSHPLAPVSAGVPVRDEAGVVVAALSVVLPAGAPDVRAFAPALLACARAIRRDTYRAG